MDSLPYVLGIEKKQNTSPNNVYDKLNDAANPFVREGFNRVLRVKNNG